MEMKRRIKKKRRFFFNFFLFIRFSFVKQKTVAWGRSGQEEKGDGV